MDKSAAAGKAGKKVALTDQVETLVDLPAPSSRSLSETTASAPEGDAGGDEDAAADFLLHDDEAGDAAAPSRAPAPKPPEKTVRQESPPSRPTKKLPPRPPTKPAINLDETQAQAPADEESEESPRTEVANPARTQAFEESESAPPARPPARAAAQSAAQSAAAASAKPQPGGTQKTAVLGDYRLLKKLGQGGMGSVYRAHQMSLDREVAIKVLSKELASKPAFVQRFLREARVMAKLDHPNILRCYEVGEAMGFHFLSMEFVEGGTVESWLKKLGRFSIGDALHLTLAVAHALQHAHELTLIHRDIKPENILLTKRGLVKVADLGLAKAQDDDLGLTRTGTGAGTPLYMAPEQARDAKHVDARCDIYAVGCMLYTFLAGQPPFKGETLVELIEAKEKGKCPPVRQFNHEVPERLGLMIDKMIASKPDHRYQSCAEITVELEAMGLANVSLDFFPKDGPAVRPPPGPAPKKISVPKELGAAPRGGAGTGAADTEANLWYVNLLTPAGKSVTRKVTTNDLLGLFKNKSVDGETPVSRTREGPFRSLGTFGEFVHLTKAKVTTDRAERRGEKFKNIYKKIEKEERSRLRWRWLHNLFLRTGGMLGLILWLIVIVGVLVGGFFLVKWGIQALGDRLPFTQQ